MYTVSNTNEDRVDHGEPFRIEELNAASEVYGFFGHGSPHGSSAVSKAKKQFADDNDFDYNNVKGTKVARPSSRDVGAVVVVVHDPKGQAKRQFP